MSSIFDNLCAKYSSNIKYTVGSQVMNGYNFYQCIKDTSGTFDSTCWKRIYLADILKGARNPEINGLQKNSFYYPTRRVTTFINLGFTPTFVTATDGSHMGNSTAGIGSLCYNASSVDDNNNWWNASFKVEITTNGFNFRSETGGRTINYVAI